MTSTPDRDPPSARPESSPAEPDETATQREQRKADEADEAWAESEKQRKADEIARRVKEEWRNPFN